MRLAHETHMPQRTAQPSAPLNSGIAHPLICPHIRGYAQRKEEHRGVCAAPPMLPMCLPAGILTIGQFSFSTCTPSSRASAFSRTTQPVPFSNALAAETAVA